MVALRARLPPFIARHACCKLLAVGFRWPPAGEICTVRDTNQIQTTTREGLWLLVLVLGSNSKTTMDRGRKQLASLERKHRPFHVRPVRTNQRCRRGSQGCLVEHART